MDIINNSNKFVKSVSKTTPVDIARTEIKINELKSALKPAKQPAPKKPEGTRRERIAEERSKRADEIEKKVREAFFSMAKTTAREVAETLAGLSFDGIGRLEADDLMRIKGIGPKYAEQILAQRWELSGRLVHADEYELDVEVKPQMAKRSKVSFFANYDPNKHSVKEMVVKKDITLPQGALDEFLIAHGYESYDVLITAVGYIKENPNKPTSREIEQKAAWERWCRNGFTARGGKKFRVMFHGTNAGRKCEAIFVREDVYDIVYNFVTCEARNDGVATEAKLAAYMGLNLPGTIKLEDYIGINIEPEAIALTKEYKKIFPKQRVDFVDIEKGIVHIDVVRDVIENMFDGQAAFHISDKMLKKYLDGKTQKEKERILRKLKKAKNFTLRGPWLKGLTIKDFDFHAVLRKLGVKYVKTKDGRLMDIDDIVILADESVFKASIGEKGHYHSWQEYCEAFRRQGHSLRVLIQEHTDKLHALPFQQLQSMVGGDKEALAELIDKEVNKLMSYQNKDNAIALLGGEMAKIVHMCPGLLRHPWVMKRIKDTYNKLYAEATGGKTHGNAHYLFLGKDPVAMAQHIAWACSDISEELQKKFPKEEDYVTGVIKAGHVVCAINEKGFEGVMSRNPSTDAQAQCLVHVDKDFGEWSWAFTWSTTCYASVNSYETTRIRGDHDGDHIFLSFVAAVIKLAKSAAEFTGGRLIDWVAPSTQKHVVTKESMIEYFCGLTKQSQLGHWCDVLTSLVGFGAKLYDHKAACWLVMAVNVFVDASKHGMSDVTVPDFVLDAIAVKDEAGNILTDDKGHTISRPMPRYAMQAKDNQHPSNEEKHLGNKKCAPRHGKGNGDELRAAVLNKVAADLNIDLTGVAQFSVNELLYDYNGARNGGKSFGYRGCDELFDDGEYCEETGHYEGQGLWKEICFETGRELKEIRDGFANIENDVFAYNAALKNTRAFKRYAGIVRLNEWAALNGRLPEDVYDAVTFHTFVKLQYPVQRKNETAKDYEKRIEIFNIMFEGWVDIYAGMALRAILLRNRGLQTGIGLTDDAANEDADYSVYDDMLEDIA